MQNHKILWTFGSKYSRGSTLFIIKNRRQSRIIASFSVLVLFALTYAIVNPIYVEHDGAYAVTGSATAATTSLTLSTANNLASMHVVPTANGGTFASSNAADSAAFNVNTNNYTGYTLAISSDDDSGRLESTDGYIESINSALTTSAFDNSVNNNKWGYRPSKYMKNDAVVDNTGETAVFLPSPTTVATVLDRTTTANATNNAYTIALGARVDYSVMSGSYHKNFNLIATANPISYTINYNQNTAETVTGMPETQSSATSETSITLANNTPERAHYTFLGWCSTATTASNGVDSCSGTTYQPNGAYGIDQTTTNITTLYAMWKINSHTLTITKDGYISTVSGAGMHNYGEVVTITASPSQGNEFVSWAQTAGNTISFANAASATTTFVMPDSNVTINASGKVSAITFAQAFANAGKTQTNGYYSMQDVSPSICSAVTTGQTASLRDTRDGEIYTVGKLADNRCWLLDNLRLDIVNTSLDALKGKTNASDVALEYLKGVRVDNFYGRYAQSGAFDLDQSALESSFHLSSRPVISAAYKDVVPSSGYQGKAGVYYSSCAALAGAFCSENWAFFARVDQYIDNKAVFSSEITEDVCPKGWRMPTGGSSGEYQALYTAYSSDDTNFMNALHTPFSGVIDTSISSPGGVKYLNQNGKFWSATNASAYATSVYFMALEVYVAPRVNLTQTNNGMISMRCIIPESGSVANFSYNIQYDKNTTSTVTNMPANQSGSTEFKNSGIAVANNTPSRSGYRFIGWCNTRPTTMNGIDYCSSDTFAPNDIYEIGARTSVNVTFYAMWLSVSSAIAMQDVTISQCSTSPMLVYDNRDYEVYVIQKLADNKCWLLDNLRLDLSNIQKLTPANTNISSDWTIPAEINTRAWDGDRSKARIFADAKLLLQSYGSGNSRDGVYYSFCTASAGTYCHYVSNPPTDISYDICPKGWRIPTGKSNDGEYKALYTAYSSDGATFANAFRAIGSGSFSNGGISSFVSNQGGVGYFWSSSLGNYTDNYHRYVLLANSSGSNIRFTAIDNSTGASVRCVLK